MSTKRSCDKDVEVPAKKEADKNHACQLCDYRTSRSNDLHRHYENTHGEKKFVCGTCDAKFGGQSLLERHVKSAHASDKKYSCGHCDYQTNYSANLRQHNVRKHAEKQFACGSCGKKFGSQMLLELHVKGAHATDKKHSCEQCDYQAHKPSDLRKHYERKHAEKKFTCGNCGKNFGGQTHLAHHVKTAHASDKKYFCEHCNYHTSSRSYLHEHYGRVHAEKTFACLSCHSTFGCQQALTQHVKAVHGTNVGSKESDVNYSCVHCDYQTSYSSRLRQHNERKHAEKQFACGNCEKKFGGQMLLDVHVKRAHATVKKYSCELCDYQAHKPSDLRMHYERKHAEKKFTCGDCGKKFGGQTRLEVHIKTTHASDKKYSCERCNYQTSCRYYLHKHYGRKHAEKTFACGSCDARFGSPSALAAHGKYVHGTKRWHCQTCGKRFARKAPYKIHVFIHATEARKCGGEKMQGNTREEAYSCDICTKRCRTIAALVRHVFIVHELKKYRCEHCAKAFSGLHSLNDHTQFYHAKDLPCTFDGCDFVGIDYKSFEDHLVEVHGEPRARKCSVCDTWYTRKAGLKKHLTSVHNGERLYDCWCGYATDHRSLFEAHKDEDDCKPKPLMLENFGELGRVAKSGSLTSDYVLEGKVLGRGINCVYRARRKDDPATSWKFAVKQIKLDGSGNSAKRASYAKALTEAKLMLKFEHQNLMSAETVYSNDKFVSIVMDLVQPGSLCNVMKAVSSRRLRFAEVAVAAVIKGATEGLVYLHSQGKLHRDMKSANILLDENGIAKLTDFGQTATNGPARFTGVGTPMFAAPELNKCAGSATPQTNAIDVWPLPLIAVECLTQAEIPTFDFINDHFREEVHAWCSRKMIDKDQPQPTQAFKDFVNACLVKDPAERFPANGLLSLPFLENADESSLRELVQQILS